LARRVTATAHPHKVQLVKQLVASIKSNLIGHNRTDDFMSHIYHNVLYGL